MKNNLILFVLFMILGGSIYAQSPEGFNYQAVARDANGEVITDELVSIRFWIYEDSPNGTSVYREVHSDVNTGPQGIFNLVIGGGTPVQSNLSNVDWADHSHFVRVDIDIDNGTNFVQMGTSQLLSVPYAMYAKSAGNAGGGGDDWGNQTVESNNTLMGDGTSGNPLRVNVDEVNSDEQTLSINGAQLSISNGNTVTLPTTGGGTSPWTVNADNEAVFDGGNPGSVLASKLGFVLTTSDQGNVTTFLGDVQDRGAFSLNDANSIPKIRAEINEDQAGVMRFLGENGNTNVLIDPFSNAPNFGTISLHGDGGGRLINILAATNNSGRIDMQGVNGESNIVLVSSGNGNMGSIQLNQEDGSTQIYAGAKLPYDTFPGEDNKGEIRINNTLNNPIFRVFESEFRPTANLALYQEGGVKFNHSLSSLDNGGGRYDIFNQNSVPIIAMGASSSNPKTPFLRLRDTLGLSRIVMTVSEEGVGRIISNLNEVYGPNNFQNISLGSNSQDANKGEIRVYDDNGDSKVFIGIGASSNVGGVVTDRFVAQSEDGRTSNVTIGGTPSSNNQGEVIVWDENNTPQAGMSIDANGQGFLFADIKNFRMDDPVEADQEIWYASLEGPEAGAYDRGTATLVNGRVEVRFSEHFMKVINENNMTIQLTPLSLESKGLAVAEKTATGFVVGELHNGTGNYSFDWTVHSQRTGFEDYQVVRQKKDRPQAIIIPPVNNKKVLRIEEEVE